MQAVDLVGKIVRQIAAEDTVAHGPEDGSSEPSVRAAGMRWANPMARQHISEILQSRALAEVADDARAFRCKAALTIHTLGMTQEKLDVPKFREICAYNIKESALVFRKALRSKKLDEVAEIVSTMKRQPVHLIREDEAGCGEKRAKSVQVDAHFAILVELNATLLK